VAARPEPVVIVRPEAVVIVVGFFAPDALFAPVVAATAEAVVTGTAVAGAVLCPLTT
jgi:hypothetical protein